MMLTLWFDGQRDQNIVVEEEPQYTKSWEVRIEELENKVRELERICFRMS
jgi:archaellum component FlaC